MNISGSATDVPMHPPLPPSPPSPAPSSPPSPSQPHSPTLETSGTEPLPHVVAMAIVQRELQELLGGDPYLADLPADVRAEEVNLQIALEHGQALTVIVKRADDVAMPIVVMQSATVLDLKRAIKRYFELKQDREDTNRRISWRYVWRSYYLSFEGEKLSDDYKRIREYGIRNRSEVTFLKRLHAKEAGY